MLSNFFMPVTVTSPNAEDVSALFLNASPRMRRGQSANIQPKVFPENAEERQDEPAHVPSAMVRWEERLRSARGLPQTQR
jgi:hypothetical protein